MKGKLFAVSGPSGVGKNTILNLIMERRESVQYSVSATTREMRPGEVDGKSYYFLSRTEFEAMIERGEQLEHAEYVGNYYGTPLKPILEAMERGIDVVMDVEVVGALNIKKRLPEAVLVFVLPPSFAELRRRLLERGDVSPEAMEQRLTRARWECAQAPGYDYNLINDDLQSAADRMDAIMTAEKNKAAEHKCFVEQLIKEEL